VRRKAITVERDDAVQIATEHLEPSRRKGMMLHATVEYPDCWSVSFEWPDPSGEIRALPTILRLEVDKLTKQVTECPGR
jgi:hypothetical protein